MTTYLHRHYSSKEETFRVILNKFQASKVVSVGWKDLLLLLHITKSSSLNSVIKYSDGIKDCLHM